MADKVVELRAALKGMRDKGLRAVLAFVEFLKKHGEKKGVNK